MEHNKRLFTQDIPLRVIEFEEKNKDINFYVQTTATAHFQMTGISTSSMCTLGKFRKGIYVGPHAFKTVEEAFGMVDLIENGLEDCHFVPNTSHHREHSIIRGK